MNDRLKAELDEEFDKLNALSPSDEGYKEATERFTKVYSLYLEGEKNQADAEFKKMQIKNDELMKKAQLSETKKRQMVESRSWCSWFSAAVSYSNNVV